MDSLTSGQLARALGTSITRVHRAALRGIVPHRREPNGRLRFPPEAADVLRRRWGWCPKIQGLGREEAMVLAALSRRPLGLSSARAVARVAGLSPTTAVRVLDELVGEGYVTTRTVRIAEGRARDVNVWTIRWGSRRWLDVATDVGRSVLPSPETEANQRSVPARLAHLFWNVDVDALDVHRDGTYIADRILRDGDAQGLAWLSVAVPRDAIAEASRGRGLEPRRAALGRALASAA